jgi:hypothetical protein
LPEKKLKTSEFWITFQFYREGLSQSKRYNSEGPVVITIENDQNFKMLHCFGSHFKNKWLKISKFFKIVKEINQQQKSNIKNTLKKLICNKVDLLIEPQIPMNNSLIAFKCCSSYFLMVWNPASSGCDNELLKSCPNPSGCFIN